MKTTSEILIVRVIDGVDGDVVDEIVSETTFTLVVNGETMVSLLCSPSELDAMAVGFLLSEGILHKREDLLDIQVNEATATVMVTLKNLAENWTDIFHKKTITSGCGAGVTFTETSDLKQLERKPAIVLRTDHLRDLLRNFRKSSETYIQTGGVHSAAFTDGKDILLFAEDIGRHNAVDKLIGKAFLAGLDMEDKLLLSSGRISGEIMTKVIRNRIPVLISRTAPTCMSVANAEYNGVTLVGFARGNRMNIYTHPQKLQILRVVADEKAA